MKRLHELRDEMGFPTLMQLLGSREPRCVEHEGVVDRSGSVFSTLSSDVLNGSVDLLLCELRPTLTHAVASIRRRAAGPLATRSVLWLAEAT